MGPWGPSRSSWEAPGSPKRVPRNLPETIIGKVRQSSTNKSSKVDRKGRPSGPETRLSMFFDRFGVQFSLSLRLHRVSDSIHRGKGHTPVFTDRRDTLEGSQTFEKDRRSTTINEKTLRQRLRKRAARKKLDLGAPDEDSASIVASSASSRALLGALFGVQRHPWARFGCSQGAPSAL